MRIITATEASRNFATVLSTAEHGETTIVTRGGRRIAVIGPAPTTNGQALTDVLARFGPDEGFAADVESARALLLDAPAPWSEG
jgi:prevent-host-death family protein